MIVKGRDDVGNNSEQERWREKLQLHYLTAGE